jgi:inositol-phosphate phosphatase/L-galactose 1-phosphate phosphatase/histidinol-phosphatase
MYGCDCYAYGLLAAGYCDLVVEADLKPYDYMALVPVIQGAGGIITDWRGQPLRWQAGTEVSSVDCVCVRLCGHVLHQRALSMLQR